MKPFMKSHRYRQGTALALIFLLGGGASWAATATSTTTSRTPAATSSKAGATRGSTARGPLPDPVLLDGSAHAAEKRPEYGMVGDFELPGDENARNNRVGGPQGQPPGQGGTMPMPTPSAGGLPPMGLPSASGAGAAGQQIPQIPDPLAQQGQGGSGPQNPDAAGKQVEGAGQQGGPQGQQVGQLSGEGGGPEQGQIGDKPQQISIGDSAMQIKTVANPASIVGGAQPAGKTQQHEKTPGSGGKGAQGNNSNKGVERGRAMPAGL